MPGSCSRSTRSKTSVLSYAANSSSQMASSMTSLPAGDSRLLDTVEETLEHSFKEVQLVAVGPEIRANQAFKDAVKKLNLSVVYVDAIPDNPSSSKGGGANDVRMAYVLHEFNGAIFSTLRSSNAQILGPTLIIQLAAMNLEFPNNNRPQYSNAMANVTLCFTGFKVKEELMNLVNLVHHMGGTVRKDMSNSSKVTHLVANHTSGEKYRLAVSMGRPIMDVKWIRETWSRRDDPLLAATEESWLVSHRLPVFFGCFLSFVGFGEDEQRHLEETAESNAATVVTRQDPRLTHILVDDGNFRGDFEEHEYGQYHIVKGEWFWGSIHMTCKAEEALYVYSKEGDFVPASRRTPGTPTSPRSHMTNRKRRALKENLAHLAQGGDNAMSNFESPTFEVRNSKKRLSNADKSQMSLSGLSLDATPDALSATPTGDDRLGGKNKDKTLSATGPPGAVCGVAPAPASVSKRQMVAKELLQTEKNYVSILRTITNFKEELENEAQTGGAVLDAAEIKLIFGHIGPIFDVHSNMLKELDKLIEEWTEEASLGDVILKNTEDFLKAYPTFINFFETTKAAILKLDRDRPRFHAFLMIAKSRPECGRQSLIELIIRPVQRLPSVVLLLNDILKYTDKKNEDYAALDKAISSLKGTMNSINECKRKTEGHMAMFDIINDIDNVPPYLLSSHRQFNAKVDAIEVTDELLGKGDNVALFLFNDTLELCKRRGTARSQSSVKSPSVSSMSKTPTKSFKHLEILPLAHIKRVVDIGDTEECQSLFALIFRHANGDLKMFAFNLSDADTTKQAFLSLVSKNIGNTMCMTDHSELMVQQDPKELEIDTSDIGIPALTKFKRYATKTSKRVSRAFSFSRTPKKLKRCVSMSPFAFSGTGSTANLNDIGPDGFRTPTTSRRCKSPSGFSLGPTSPLARGNSAKYHGPNTMMPPGSNAPSSLSSAASTSTLNGEELFLEPSADTGTGKPPTRGDSMRESMKARLDRLVSASALDLTDEEVENTTDLAMLY